MNINTRNLGFVNFNNEEMQWVKFNGVTVYEAWKNLIASGVPPLTLLNCKGVDLVDYKIFGNSKQESENLFDVTKYNESSEFDDSGYSTVIYPVGDYSLTTKYTATNSISVMLRAMTTDGEILASTSQVTTSGDLSMSFTTTKEWHLRFYYGGWATASECVKVCNMLSDVYLKSKTPTPEAPIEVESVGDKTKNLFQDISIVGGSNTTYTNGTITQNVADTSTGIQFKLQAYKDLSFLYHIVSKSITNLGVFCLSFTKEDAFNQICFGLNGTARDTTIIIDVSTLENGKTYIISANMLNITQGTVSWNNIQIEEGETATDYEPYGKYKIPVKARGKNLFDIDKYSSYIDISKYEIGDNLVLSLKDKYILKIASQVGASGLLQVNDTKMMFTMTQEYKDAGRLFIICLKTYTYETKDNLLNQDVQLEYGTEPTEYEPYQEPITTNIYLDEPLRKIGDYTDYIDYKNKKIVRKINEFVVDGNTNKFQILVSSANNRAQFRLVNALSTNYLIPTAFCTHFAYNTTVYRDTAYDELGFISHTGFYYFRFTTSSPINTTALANEWLIEQYNAGTPMKVLYILATPTEETIELPKIPTLKGTTILEVDTEIQPSNMEVVYKGKR